MNQYSFKFLTIFQTDMTKLMLTILLALLLAGSHALEVGECVERHSDGWTCLKCRECYHLFEGKCYMDILGCT